MTREEAMEALSVLKIYDAQWLREAVDMAIEALEQQETLQNLTKPNKSDLISRQAAIDALAKEMPSLTTPDGSGEFDHDIQITDEAFVDCMQIINELPSAQPFTEEQIQTMQELEFAQVEKAYELGKADRPTGHWTEKEVFDNQDSEVIDCYQSARCSHCGKYHTTPYSYYFDNYNYCPNCGADMRGEKHGL